jgi:hypothetical protein
MQALAANVPVNSASAYLPGNSMSPTFSKAAQMHKIIFFTTISAFMLGGAIGYLLTAHYHKQRERNFALRSAAKRIDALLRTHP